MYNYAQISGGEEVWQPLPDTKLDEFIQANRPMFVTVLSVSALSEGLSREEVDKLTYVGPMYFDWDDKDDVSNTIPQVKKFIAKLVELGVNADSLKLYATGGKGFHCEIPRPIWAEKQPKGGWPHLPTVFKEVAMELMVDTLDLRVYSAKKGRMWRQPNVQRPNGRYKVPITYAELQTMTAEVYAELTSGPRVEPPRASPEYALNFAMLFSKLQEKVSGQVTKRRKTKIATVNLRSDMPSLEALCEGRGLRPGLGFNSIAMQVALAAINLGWTEEETIRRCEGLINNHQSDGRYSNEAKRRKGLLDMHRYMHDNPCYDATVGGLKSILNHAAPDLDGIPVSKKDVDEGITEADENPTAAASDGAPDEFEGLAGVTLNKYGVYANTEAGMKRICAVGFTNIELLRSMETGTISAIEADITVNGQRAVRQGLELEIFGSVSAFNKFCARYGHAFQGIDANVRGMYMRVVESGKKAGKEFYVTAREGLDIVNIPNHDNPILREPFLIWADARGVVLQPHIAETGVNIRFQGYPDTRGQFRIDLGDAPELNEFLSDKHNKDELAIALEGMMTCQRGDALSKMIGWTFACFYRMLFHRAYGKFPLLHINAPAGTGKTEMTKALMGLFYWKQEPRILSPSSTLFALSYSASGSTSPPLIIDEYKPHRMVETVKERMRLILRDAYNCRETQRGGGTRDNDDYRAIHSTTLSAPIVFIAEAVEDETAVMERSVLCTMHRSHPLQGARDYTNFQKWQRRAGLLAVLGQYLAAHIVNRYTVQTLQEEFDPIYEAAQKKFMLTAEDLESGELSREQLLDKQNTKERTVYNYAVVEFGFKKFSDLVTAIYKGKFATQLADLQSHLYDRIEDLANTTQAEWMKVLNTFSDMSYLEDSSHQLVFRKD